MGYSMKTSEFFESLREIYDFIGVGLLATFGVLLRDIFIYGTEKVMYKDGWVKRYFNYFLFFCVIGIIIEIYLNG